MPLLSLAPYPAMPFDPCREWLGIDATDLKDPHRVLAIPPTVTDGDTIARLAEARLASLAQIVPGPFAKAHAALITRVAEARDTLLAMATWAPTEEPAPAEEPSPEEPVFSLPPPPPASSSPLSVFPVTHGPADDDGPAFVSTPRALDIPAPRVPSEGVGRSASGGGGLGLFAIFLAVVIAAGYYAYKRLGVAQVGLDVAIRSVVAPHILPPPPPPPPPTTTPPTPTPSSPPAQEIPPAAEDPTTVVAPPPLEPEPAAYESEPTEPSPSMPAPPPRPDPATERRITAEREAAAAFVQASIREAFQALQQEEFDKADRAIAAASDQVGDDVASATRVERWRLMAAYARAYAGYRDKAFRSASAGREYEIDGKRIVVIEVSPANFTYRLSGRNYTVSRKTMSPVLEVGVVEAWFGADGRAANYLFVGTRWLCKVSPNHARARAAWQKAADGGENAAPLMALLDDPITQQPDGP